MTDLVDPAEIEAIVGAPRHAKLHQAKAVSAEQTVYILHSQDCRDDGRDVRECPWSRALAVHGIDPEQWPEDQPIRVNVRNGYLIPAGPSPAVLPETPKCEHGQTEGHWTPLRGAVPVHKTRQECWCPGPAGQAAES